ncbi:MAG: hypothetical protein ACOYNI_12335 [Acidimicrobiia bacterium]
MTHHLNGSPADVGRKQRLVTRRLRRLVAERDQHCVESGCSATDLENLELCCSHHHRTAHGAGHAPAGAFP